MPFCHSRSPAAMMTMMMMRMNDAANVGKLMLCMFISQTNTAPLKLKHTSLSRHLQSLQFNAINAAFTGANVPRSQFWLARLFTRWPLALGDDALLALFTQCEHYMTTSFFQMSAAARRREFDATSDPGASSRPLLKKPSFS